MNDFFSQMNETLVHSPDNFSVTENGAVGYRTSGKKLLDMNFAVSSLRTASDYEIKRRFAEVCGEDLNTAIVWLFFARDCREGQGERRLFRVCMAYLAEEWPDKVRAVLPLIAEYGRWDDVVAFIDTPLKDDVVGIITRQLSEDIANMRLGKPVSLLGKWMPSAATSSKETRRKAQFLIEKMNTTPRFYRKMLSSLRKYLDVTERKMSAGKWGEIKYEGVPSRANLIYSDAFLKHDAERRTEYLSKVEKGEAKINASVLFPHDIVHKYAKYDCWCRSKPDPAVEELWKALPNWVPEGESTLVVADGSGSMTSHVGGTEITCLDVANALAIYFAEKLPEPFRNKYITFSSRPQLVDLSGANTLLGKLQIAWCHDECSNTDIEAVFRLILRTAVKNHLSQAELPHNVLILSDMEFDFAIYGRCDASLFDEIAAEYAAHGYKLPRLVFWNIDSRTQTIPVIENELGVALVSGFSPTIAKMVMSAQTDPYLCLLETLNSPRYDAVREALK